MRTIAAIGLGIVVSVTYAHFAIAQERPQAESTARTQDSSATGDELHFVSVLTLNGEVAAVDPASLLVTIKGGGGGSSTLQVRSEKELEAIKPGDHVTVRYFEGAQVGKGKAGAAVSVPSLKEGIVGAELGGSPSKHPLVASVEGVDAANQEVTVKGPDGSLETIMVTNPEHLGQIKVGDKIVITHAEALALSLKKEG
ncbi:MAG TPA: hypothetical protein VJN94_09080 [Candidatus Binataceae bacterium]|nr:hypothetical protein [Candidatus Binataceae bacterium]